MGSGTIALEGNWTNNGTLVPGTGIVHYDGAIQLVGAQNYYNLQISISGVKTLDGNTGVSNVLTLNTPATLNLSSFDLTISGSGTPVLATGILQPGTSTVKYTNAAATTIAALDYYSLDGSGGARTLASSGTIGIAGTFTPGLGAYTITDSSIHFNGSSAQTIPAFNYFNLIGSGGDRILDPVGTIGIAGDFTPGAGSYTLTTSTVNFNGLTAQTLPEFTFNELILSETGVKTLLTGTALTANTITIQDGAVLDMEGTSVLNVTN